jgi:hypothetical protein
MKVKQRFEVEWNDSWPENMWGLKLGKVVSNIREGTIHKDKREELESIGFLFEQQTSTNYNGWVQIKLALETYKALNGDLLVSRLFVVPTEDAQWPSDTWGMKLGSIVANIKNSNHHVDHREEVIAMGIVSKHW